MSYVLVGILLLLILGGFITFMVMSATKRSDHATTSDGAPDHKPAPFAADDAPAGDTTQHAGEQPGQDGFTAGGQDADEKGGTGAATRGAESVTGGHDQDRPEGRFQRDPVGGEAEARPFTDSDR